MKDTCGRTIDYLRLSITDHCNLHCQYCKPLGCEEPPEADCLDDEALVRICTIAARTGIHTIKITGGEPLVRPGCMDLLKKIKAVEGIENVTITTNGVLLERCVPQLKAVGIDGINISLDTLDPRRFAEITGVNVLDKVLCGMHAALKAGLSVKLNCVALEEDAGQGWMDLVALLTQYPLHLRFIEVMPIGYGASFTPIANHEILKRIEGVYGPMDQDSKRHGFGPARYYRNDAFQGSVGFISAVHENFCSSCNRIRVTSEGFLKACLYSDTGCDMGAMLKARASDQALQQAMEQVITNKPAQHHFYSGNVDAERRTMAQIGG